ncbi:MAG TPA: matrixin family metalloprotease [Gemmatimonadaceae bacterium]
MRPAHALALIVGFQLTLVSCVGSGIAPRAQLLRVVSTQSSGAFAPRLDSVSCGSGAAASDVGVPRSAASTEKQRFAPRWREDSAQTVTVRVDNATSLAGWAPEIRTDVVSALQAWESSGSPVKFSLVTSDDHADVRVHWIDKFDSRYEGWTTISWDHSGWILNADVTLALRSPSGQLLTSGERTQVAMHEMGHVLGLSHSSSTASIMSPTVKVTAIAPEDVSSLRALYAPTDSSEFALSAAQRGSGVGDRCAARKAD